MFVLDAGLFLGSLLGAHEALEIGSWMPDDSCCLLNCKRWFLPGHSWEMTNEGVILILSS
jgi:hypothetical protein